MLTGAVVGAGMGGRLSLAALQRSPHFELVAVADIRAEALETARQMYPHLRTFQDPVAMFAACPVDVVCISAPPPTHEALAAAALALPLKGILVEKPLGHNWKSGTAVLKAIQSRRLPLAVPHGLLVQNTPRHVLQHLQAGAIGRIVLIEIQCTRWDIINAGIHWLDFCVHALDMPAIDHVLAQCDTRTRTFRDSMQVETAAVTYIQTAEGTRIVMQTGDEVDVGRAGAGTLMRFVGTRGQIEFWPWMEGYHLLNAAHPGGSLLQPPETDDRSRHQIHLDNLAGQVARGAPDYGIARGSLQALALCEAAYLSSRHRCQVRLPLDRFVPPPPVAWNPGMPYDGQGGGRDGRALP